MKAKEIQCADIKQEKSHYIVTLYSNKEQCEFKTCDKTLYRYFDEYTPEELGEIFLTH